MIKVFTYNHEYSIVIKTQKNPYFSVSLSKQLLSSGCLPAEQPFDNMTKFKGTSCSQQVKKSKDTKLSAGQNEAFH